MYKQRVAVGGQGKRGGSRVIIAANLQDRWIFVHCYGKNDKSDISSAEENAFREFARIYLNLTEATIETAVKRGVLEALYEDESHK